MAGRVPAVAKNDVVSHGVSVGIHGGSRCRGLPVGMHAHVAEIVTEARFHERTRPGVKRLAWPLQNVVHDTGGNGRCARILRVALQALRFALRTLLVPFAAAGALALQNGLDAAHKPTF
jgi:hypothetical protein